VKIPHIKFGAIAYIAASCILAAVPAYASQDGSTVQWNGTPLQVDSIEEQVPNVKGLAAQIARYTDWVQENKYHMGLSKDGRVVLITESATVLEKRMKLVEASLQSFDKLMAPPNRNGSKETYRVSTWGAGQHEPDSEPVVLIEVKKEGQFRDLCQGIGVQEPNLSAWASSVAGSSGFAQEQLSAAAWQAAPDGYELGTVWRPENELVNRLARMLLFRSYGTLPTWLRVASAWHVEMEVMDSLYCFPYRSEFVGIGEHSGWEKQLKSEFKKRKKTPLQFNEFGGWQRNTWDADHASYSWGVVQYLARHQPGSLPAVAESFRVMTKEGSLTTHADGSWNLNTGYQIPVEAQFKVLQDKVGDEVMEQTSAFLRAGKRYKPKRSKSKGKKKGKRR